MLPYALLGIAILFGTVLIIRWFVSAEPKAVLKMLKWAGFCAAATVILFLAVTGRLGWALGVAVVLLPWAMRILRTASTARSYARMATGASGRSSNVETRFLRMSLDHDSGDLDGEVIEGTYTGRRLAELTLAELMDLLGLCRNEDHQSAQILEAYLDRVHPDWRDRETDGAGRDGAGRDGARRDGARRDGARRDGARRDGGGEREGRGGEGAMTREEAYEVLGLQPGASEAEIKSAYHRLIAGLHPDKGGSTFLAAKVNQAKDVLLDH